MTDEQRAQMNDLLAQLKQACCSCCDGATQVATLVKQIRNVLALPEAP